MHGTHQQYLQDSGLAPAAQTRGQASLLDHHKQIQTALNLTQRALLNRYQDTKKISFLVLLTHKSESLELHRAVLKARLGAIEKSILLGYLDHNIDIIDEAIGGN